MTVKVTNLDTKAVFIHYGLSRAEVGWIEANPNLRVEILKKR